MSDESALNRRTILKTSAAAAIGASVAGVASGEDKDTVGAGRVDGELRRFATTALGAEVTGPFVFQDGTLLFSLQHPSNDNPEPWNKGGIGYVKGFTFEMDGTNSFEELSAPQTKQEQSRVRVAEGEYEILAQQEEKINGGTERLGVPQTPDGTDIDKFAGSRYSDFGNDPDCNQFVPTNEDGTEGYLFTNFEQSPGEIARIPLTQEAENEWSADLDNAINLSNTEEMRSLGGTRINCYGDRTPWNTMVSSEENYAHPRVSLTNNVSDVQKSGSGEGILGAQAFWNRPNPSGIQGAVSEEYSDVDGWYVQGYWAATGVELLAYYLGADPVDQDGFDPNTEESLEPGGEAAGTNTKQPIDKNYPNPYRYGYHIDIRKPAAETPQPVKYWVMGRTAWEAPDFQADEKTVYMCCDGDSKGIYKFVADEAIPSYDDTANISGTLYAPKITNPEAATNKDPEDVALEVEWMELGSATNGEVESWIAEYDDVTQVDYLETHASTDWQEDLDAAIEEADKEVIANGNQNYITDQEIMEWARQYEQNGPDGVDEKLRRVPFLETRAAAKEIGASIEFNKAEGVDSMDGAGPGDYVYFGISEFNDDLANSKGDLQLDRVDGGIVYRAELEDDYDISLLEPVIVGPDGSDPAALADDDLVNVDNVNVMDDERVLCCEDADQFGRSYPNDGLYVYEPNQLDAQSLLERFDTNGDGVITPDEL